MWPMGFPEINDQAAPGIAADVLKFSGLAVDGHDKPGAVLFGGIGHQETVRQAG